VSYKCECWVNGDLAGEHEGSYDSFTVDVTRFLRAGQNTITVRVVNPPSDYEVDGLRSGAPLNQSNVPIGKSAWYYNFGGVWGRVFLETLPTVHLSDVWVVTERDAGRLLVRWSAHNSGDAEECAIAISICERATGRVVLTNSESVVLERGEVSGETAMVWSGWTDWSPQNPFLYIADVTLGSSDGTHEVSCQFGVREFRVDENRFALNDERIVLHGLLQQGAYPRRLAGPESWRIAARELIAVRKAGFNFIRIHLKPANDWYLDFADRLGILVMLEPPVGWIANTPETEARVEREVRAVIRGNRSRVCCIMWGLYNESFHHAGYTPDQVREVAGRMLKIAREVDDSRLIIDTSGGYARVALHGAETMIHDTFSNGPSRYMQPRSGIFEEIVDIHAYCPMPPSPAIVDQYRTMNSGNRPLFVAEYGAAEAPPEYSKVLATYTARDREVGLEDWRLHEDFSESLNRRFEQAGLEREFQNVDRWIAALNLERAREVAQIAFAGRRNSGMSAMCYCQLADASGELFGVLDFWRRPKVLLETLSRAIAETAIGIVPTKNWVRLGEDCEATFAVVSECGCEGDASIEVTDPSGIVHTVFEGKIVCDPAGVCERKFTYTPFGEGIHTIRARALMADGRRLECAEIAGALADVTSPALRVSARFAQRETEKNLESCGFNVEAFGNNFRDKDAVVLLEWAAIAKSVNSHAEMLGQIRNIVEAGGCAIIFDPDTPMLHQWLLPHFIGVQPVMRTGVYVKESPLFNGLPGSCVAGRLHESILGERWDSGDHVEAAGGIIEVGAFSMHMWTRPAKYFWAAGLYRIPLGRGQIFISHLNLLGKTGNDPLARRVLRNLVAYASTMIAPGGSELLFRRCIDRIDPACLAALD
jgi:hypothetical protein